MLSSQATISPPKKEHPKALPAGPGAVNCFKGLHSKGAAAPNFRFSKLCDLTHHADKLAAADVEGRDGFYFGILPSDFLRPYPYREVA